ncbi:MAG: hypothetical protein GF383_12385 [Candidatus Lokiarchaeota archaeon]|nr:hypothetical protein [Candidatus Lokiarchaeota archaeon]MBD3341798.1 hypothetical protein [Candidatus Lokiarchaeota archaeon]
MANRLELVLKELIQNGGFSAALFSTNTGLVLASSKEEGKDERVIAAMSSLLTDAALKVSEEMELTNPKLMKIFFDDEYIICRHIHFEDNDSSFLLTVLTKLPDSEDIEKYIDQLVDWAVENASDDLLKLSSI